MKILYYFLFLLYLINLSLNYTSLIKPALFTLKDTEEQEIGSLGLNFIKSLLNETLQTAKGNISELCYNSFDEALNEPNRLYLIKLFLDSAKNKNDLGSYLDCLTLNYRGDNNTSTEQILSNLTYIIVHMNKKNDFKITDIRSETQNYLLGACVIKNCNSTEYNELFYNINNNIGEYDKFNHDDIKTFDWGEMYKTEIYFSLSFIYEMIPIFILVFIALWSLFPSIPVCLFKGCFVNRKITAPTSSNVIEEKSEEVSDIFNFEENLVEEQPKKAYNQTNLIKLEKCFRLIENAEEIFNSKYSISDKSINNDTGLSIVKGLRGLAIIILISGSVFRILYNSPVKIYCNIAFRKLLMSYLFVYVEFGMRFCPVILFSLSSYCLMYKFLCYLDDEVEKFENENENKIINGTPIKEVKKELSTDCNERFANDKTYTFISGNPEISAHNFNSPEKLNSDNGSEDLYINYINHSQYSFSLKYSSLLYFIFSQSYKYILYAMVILVVKFSYFYLIGVLYSPGPLWLLLKEIIITKFTILLLFLRLILYNIFVDQNHILDIFFMAIHEIFYFLLFSVILFFVYKKNLRFDKFLILSFTVLIILKIVFYFMMYYLTVDKFLPSLSYANTTYFFILKNVYYNMPSTLIGLFFGSVNYCIQKSITINNVRQLNKKFLYYPCLFIDFFKNNQMSRVLFNFFVFGALFFLIISSKIIIYRLFFSNDQFMNDYYLNLWVNLFYVVDLDLGVLLMYLTIIPLILIGDNFLINFFSHDYWNILARPYFNIILVVNLITIYVFYQSESRVKLESFNIIFFSLLVLMIIIILCLIIYIFLELQLKKLNKLIIEIMRQKENSKEIIE